MWEVLRGRGRLLKSSSPLIQLFFIFGESNTSLGFSLQQLQVEGYLPVGLQLSRLVCAGLLWSGCWPCLHAQGWPGLMSQHLFAPTAINCLRPWFCGLHCVWFFSLSNFALIDSICFHLLCIDLFVQLCLVNHRNL